MAGGLFSTGVTPRIRDAIGVGFQRAALWLWVFVVSGRAQPLSPERLYQTVLPSVMTLEVERRGGEKTLGTAFLAVREGVAATAWHVVRDARAVVARFADGQTCPVLGVLDWDEVKDIALLRVEAPARPLSRLCGDSPPVGARAYVIGAPQGYEFSLSDGLVSQVRSVDGFPQCQISCPISPGNSGGPVFNERGEVLGVVTWSKKDAQNLNFATPAGCLAHLEAQAAPIPWQKAARQRRARDGAPPKQRGSASLGSVRPAADDDLSALRSLLRESAGEPVSITVGEGANRRAFRVTLPRGFVN